MENEDIQYEDFKNACRLCLRKSLVTRELLFLQIKCEENEESGDNGVHETDRYLNPIVQMIKICTGMTLSPDDELPKSICMICSNKLTQFTKFREQCLESEKKLKEALQQYHNREYLKDPLDLNSIEDNCSDQERRCIFNIEQNKEKSEIDEYIVKGIKNQDDDDGKLNVNEMEILTEQVNAHEYKDSEEKNVLKSCKDNNTEEEQQNHKSSDKSKAIKKKKEYKRTLKQCQICGKIYRELSAHMKAHYGIKNFKCTICSKSFSSSSNFKEHMYAHSNLRSFKCRYCDSAFNTKKTLNAHELRHSQEEKYKCDICGRKFKHPQALSIHKRVHSIVRAHKCDVCSRDFKTKIALKKHNFIHTGEKPYQCPYCDKCFNNPGGLSQHKRYKHTKTISVRCENCNVGFLYKPTYYNHIKKCRSNDNENR